MTKKLFLLFIIISSILIFSACKPIEVEVPKEEANETQKEIGVNIGNIATDAVVTDFEGKEVKLSDYKGQVIFLNFWATWCPPCQQEMPDFEEFYNKRKNEGVTIFAINAGEDLATVQAYFEEQGYTFPAYIDLSTDAPANYKVSGIPTTLIINRDFEIIDKKVGAITLEQMNELYTKALQQ